MGPIALFDKSFLQSLTVDESVWFDHFFLPVVSPLFFVETLADLAKQGTDGSRSPEDEVRIIADKTPVQSGAPCVHHSQICISNLLGQQAPHLGQIPVAGGRPVRGADGKPGVVFEKSPEAEAFARWQRGRFHEVEHDIASNWRAMLSELNLSEVAQRMRALGITPQTCKSVEEAYGIAARLVHSRYESQQQLGLLFSFVQIPVHLQARIAHRWSEAGFPPLAEYAGFAAHVLKVELFFQIALAANLISADRPSNRADIAYLFYLPFCHVFVSGDKLHRRCAPIFLSKQQDFVWAPDLKDDLARINRELMSTSEEQRQEGLHKLASRPPGDASTLVVSLWQKHAPSSDPDDATELTLSPETERKLVEHHNSFAKAPTAPDVADLPADEIQSVSIERLVPAKKGSWWLIPKRVADAEGHEEA
ncbi:MAG: hypothetical protein NTW90_09405 [Nitrosospira sp.]|nr:hypothetical protein [Nitrosospira sp.]